MPQATQRHSYSTRDEANRMLMWAVRPWAWISTEVPPERVGSWIILSEWFWFCQAKIIKYMLEHFCLYCRHCMTLHNKRNWNTLIVSYSYLIFCVRILNYWYSRRSCSSLLSCLFMFSKLVFCLQSICRIHRSYDTGWMNGWMGWQSNAMQWLLHQWLHHVGKNCDNKIHNL